MQNIRNLDGMSVIITGAGRGIGRETARRFASEGAQVLLVSRTAENANETLAAIESAGGQASIYECNLQHRHDVRSVVEVAVSRHGKLDTIIHNAGFVPFGALTETSDADLEQAIAVNYKLAFWFAAEAFPHLSQSHQSSLIFTSSITGNREWRPNYVAYGASKAALNSFVKSAAAELGPNGIRVNAVEPGLTRTELVAELGDDLITNLTKHTPLGRAAHPSDIADAILFLASPQARHITGQTLAVDGGQYLAVPN